MGSGGAQDSSIVSPRALGVQFERQVNRARDGGGKLNSYWRRIAGSAKT